MSPEANETPTTRATLFNAPSRYRPDIDRWAIIVGISKYQHTAMNLKWAHRDAEELYQLLLTPAGGSFAADHLQLLVDAQATTQAICERIRRETLAEVENAFGAYLAAGAPVGHRREVVGFLHKRTSSKADLPAR